MRKQQLLRQSIPARLASPCKVEHTPHLQATQKVPLFSHWQVYSSLQMSYTNHISIPHQSRDFKLETNKTVLESFIQAEDKTSYLVHSCQVKVKAEIQTLPKFRRSKRSSNLVWTLHCGSQHHFDYSPCMPITAQNLSNFFELGLLPLYSTSKALSRALLTTGWLLLWLT